MKTCIDCGKQYEPTGKHQKRCIACGKARKKAYRQTPEYKAREKARDKARRKTPEYKAREKARQKALRQTPEYKARHKAYDKAYGKVRKQTPEYKAYQKAYEKARWKTPEYKAREKARWKTPEYKAYKKALRQTPEYKAYGKAYGKAYRQTPEGIARIRVSQQRRRARIKKLPATFTVTDWRLAIKHFQHSCAYCGEFSNDLHQEHFVPAVDDGGYTPDNIVPACPKCNLQKHTKTARNFLNEIGHIERYEMIVSYLQKQRRTTANTPPPTLSDIGKYLNETSPR